MLKVLIILEAGRAPSGITRGLIYEKLFRENGYKCKYVSRNSLYLLQLSVKPPWVLKFLNPAWIGSVAVRLNRIYVKIIHQYIIFLSDKFDLVYTSKVWDYNLLHTLKVTKNKRIVFDFGDSVWLYRSNYKFNEILSMVDVITTDNKYMVEYIKKYNSNCFVIPDYPQLEIFDKLRKNKKTGKEKIIIGWIGSPTTLFNNSIIWKVLHDLFIKFDNIHLRLVGVGRTDNIFPDYYYIDYSTRGTYNQKEMAEEILNMDIGLFPLQDIEASKVRGVLKASVYMCGGVPVISSAIGESNDFIQDGYNGFLAENEEEWMQKLERLIVDKQLRETIGKNGLDTVRSTFSLESNFKKLISAFNKI